MNRRIIIVEPHGFCSGVTRAVQTAHKLLDSTAERPLYCLHEIVHNRQVVGELRDQGMVFVNSVEEVPEGALLLLSAHGVAPAVKQSAEQRSLRIVDAVCPFVSKVHAEVREFVAQGMQVLCIGHRNHEEVIGVVGEAPGHVYVVESEQEAQELDLPSDMPLGLVTQTTLGAAHVDGVSAVLQRRFRNIQQPPVTDVCYATRNRQAAVQKLAASVQRVLVLGSANSSNSRRLVECALAEGTESFLISQLSDLDSLSWTELGVVGITGGASTPESFLDSVVGKLRSDCGFQQPEIMIAVEERASNFALPL